MPVEPSGRTPSGSRVARDSLVGVHVEVNAAGWNIWLFTTGSVISIGVTPEMKQDGKHGVRKLLNCHSTSVQNKVCAPAAAPQAPVTLVFLAHTDSLCWAGSKSSWHHLAPHSHTCHLVLRNIISQPCCQGCAGGITGQIST